MYTKMKNLLRVFIIIALTAAIITSFIQKDYFLSTSILWIVLMLEAILDILDRHKINKK